MIKQYNLYSIIKEELNYLQLIEAKDPCKQVEKIQSKIDKLQTEYESDDVSISREKVIETELGKLDEKLKKAQQDCANKNNASSEKDTAVDSDGDESSKKPSKTKYKPGPVQKQYPHPDAWEEKGVGPGNLPDSSLRTAPWLGNEKVKLSVEAYYSIACLYQQWLKANPDGALSNELKPNFVSGYRSYRTSWNLIDWKYVEKNKGTDWKTIPQNGKRYPIAEPGETLHGLGNAIDISVNSNENSFWSYLKSNGQDYGWSHPLPAEDPPHFRYDDDTNNQKNNPQCSELRGGGDPPTMGLLDTFLYYLNPLNISSAKDAVFYVGGLLFISYFTIKFGGRGISKAYKLIKGNKAKWENMTEADIINHMRKDQNTWKRFCESMRSSIGGPGYKLVSLQKTFFKEIDLAVQEGRISKAGGERLKAHVRAQEQELIFAFKNRTFKHAMKMYREGKLTYEEFIQLFPKELRESKTFTMNFELMYKQKKKLEAPFKVEVSQGNQWRQGYKDARQGSRGGKSNNAIKYEYHPNQAEIDTLIETGMLPVEGVGGIKDVKELNTTSISLNKGSKPGNRPVIKNTKHIQKQLRKPPAKLPEKWFTKDGFPENIDVWRKDLDAFSNGEYVFPSNVEPHVYNQHYWQVEAYKVKNGTMPTTNYKGNRIKADGNYNVRKSSGDYVPGSKINRIQPKSKIKLSP